MVIYGLARGLCYFVPGWFYYRRRRRARAAAGAGGPRPGA
jgi:hypothetical protein